MVSYQRPLNIETQYEVAIVNSLQDPIQQGRVRISTATLSTVPMDSLPWAKATIKHSQCSSAQGGTVESAHSFKMGDYILVHRPTASEQDWIIDSGHPGTITDAQGGQGGQGGGGQ